MAIQGLQSKPELNGKLANIAAWSEKNSRWKCRLIDPPQSLLELKEKNLLVKISAADNEAAVDAAAAAKKSQADKAAADAAAADKREAEMKAESARKEKAEADLKKAEADKRAAAE